MTSPLTTIAVAGRYVDASNRPAYGYVYLTPVTEVTGQGWVVVGTRVRANINAGVLDGQVIVNQPSLSGPLYIQVSENINGVTPKPPFIVRPEGSVLDLATAPRLTTPPPGQLYLPASALGQPNGVATLDADGKLTAGQRPPGGGGGGVTLHHDLDGLDTDDHPQYVTHTEGDAAYAAKVHAHAQGDVTGLTAALNGKEAAGTAVVLLNQHLDAADPHPQYLTQAEGGAAYAALAHMHAQGDVTGLTAALDGKEPTGTAAATLQVHLDTPNPHPQYLTEAEGDAAYAALAHVHAQGDVTGLTAALAGKEAAGTAAAGLAAHVGAADPHPQYAEVTELAAKADRVRVARANVMAANPWVVPNTGDAWTPFTASGELPELVVAAAVGDDVEVSFQVLTQALTDFGLDLATITGDPGTQHRYFSTATTTPAFQGLPCAYPMGSQFQTVTGARLGLTVTAGDLDDGLVRVAFVLKSGNANGRMFGTANYPLVWSLHNNGPAAA